MDVATAAMVGKQAIGTISDLMAVMADLTDRNISSLTAYTKRTLITSRVYVEDQLATEEVTPKLMKLLNSMYTGFVLTAIGMGNMVMGGKTVRDMTNAVATEDFHSFLDVVKNQFGDLPVMVATEGNDEKNAKDDKQQYTTANEKDLKTESAALFTGKLLSVNVPDGKGGTIPLYFYVQLLPQVIPGTVMEQFVSTNTNPSRSLRWAMWKSGEISFWKDLVFEHDRVMKRAKALKVDKEGILREMEDHKQSSFMKKLHNFFDKAKQSQRHNDANSIIICTKSTMDRACRELGINLKNYGQRQSMLANTMSVMLCVVDTNYGTVDLYMNGIEGRGEYSTKMIEAATKGNTEPLNIKDLLALISAGSMPRF